MATSERVTLLIGERVRRHQFMTEQEAERRLQLIILLARQLGFDLRTSDGDWERGALSGQEEILLFRLLSEPIGDMNPPDFFEGHIRLRDQDDPPIIEILDHKY